MLGKNQKAALIYLYHRDWPQTTGEVGKHLGLTAPSAHSSLTKLGEHDLVQTRKYSKNRVWRLTKRGKGLVELMQWNFVTTVSMTNQWLDDTRPDTVLEF